MARLSTEVFYGKSLDGADYLPGCVGLNNLNKTDFFAVVIQVCWNQLIYALLNKLKSKSCPF